MFTGGIGEHQPQLRQQAVDRLGWLGLTIDSAANAAASPDDALVSPRGSPAAVVVVHAREDLEIAAGARTAVARHT